MQNRLMEHRFEWVQTLNTHVDERSTMCCAERCEEMSTVGETSTMRRHVYAGSLRVTLR